MTYAILSYLLYPFIWLASRAFSRPDGPVLVVQTAKIGDMICSTPVFREIKLAFPDRKLAVMADPLTAPLLKHNHRVDEIIEFDSSRHRGLLGRLAFASILRKKRFYTAVILLPNSANLFIPFWALIPKRVSVYPDYCGSTLKALLRLATDVEPHLNGRMALETYLESLKFIGIETYSLRKEAYSLPQSEKKAADFLGKGRYVGIVLGTGNALKDWGREGFEELTGLILRDTPFDVVFLGAPTDRAKGEAIAAALREDKRIRNSCGSFGLSELPALIKKLMVVIGVDTGLIYMADALDVPVIDIAGPCSMSDQRPVGDKALVVQSKGLECVPCSFTFKAPYRCRFGHRECVTGITAEDVMGRLLEMPGIRQERS